MAKDILIDTNTGDSLVPDKDKKIEYFDVVWGRLFDDDRHFYMNIVVPYKYMDKLKYDENGEFICNVHADYCPVMSYFFVRFVSLISSTGKYLSLQDNIGSVPLPSEALYLSQFTSTPQLIKASQIYLIDENGYLSILFKQFNQGSYTRAILCSSGGVDFKVGGGDSQSAQLLARCAPGKYYRFPTSGLDITKYINSVVEHTALKNELVSEFQKDYKNVTDASFDTSNGNLNIVFTGANEADDSGLSDPDTLDLELLRIADDDYVKALYRSAQSVLADDGEFLADVIGWSDKLIGIWDVGGGCKLEKTDYVKEVISPKTRITNSGLAADDNAGYRVSSIDCQAGRLYALNYVGGQLPLFEGYFVTNESGHRAWYGKWDALVMFKAKEGNGQYIGDDFYATDYSLGWQYKRPINRRCFMPIVDCTAYYYAGSQSDDLNEQGYGLRPISYEKGNFATILGIVMHPITGKLYGITSLDSVIDEVRIDLKTSQLFVIKHSKG